jgi:hypothetical protein
MRTARLAAIGCLVGVCLVPLVFGQTVARPNFSGTWNIDVARSDFATLPLTKVYTLTIEHKEPHVNVGRDLGEQQDSSAFRTDGVETKVDSDCCGVMRTTGRWDGATMIRRLVSEAFTQVDHWTLSADGKTLTIARDVRQDGGDFKIRMVFAKKN